MFLKDSVKTVSLNPVLFANTRTLFQPFRWVGWPTSTNGPVFRNAISLIGVYGEQHREIFYKDLHILAQYILRICYRFNVPTLTQSSLYCAKLCRANHRLKVPPSHLLGNYKFPVLQVLRSACNHLSDSSTPSPSHLDLNFYCNSILH